MNILGAGTGVRGLLTPYAACPMLTAKHVYLRFCNYIARIIKK